MSSLCHKACSCHPWSGFKVQWIFWPFNYNWSCTSTVIVKGRDFLFFYQSLLCSFWLLFSLGIIWERLFSQTLLYKIGLKSYYCTQGRVHYFDLTTPSTRLYHHDLSPSSRKVILIIIFFLICTEDSLKRRIIFPIIEKKIQKMSKGGCAAVAGSCSDIQSGTKKYMSLYPRDSTDGGKFHSVLIHLAATAVITLFLNISHRV